MRMVQLISRIMVVEIALVQVSLSLNLRIHAFKSDWVIWLRFRYTGSMGTDTDWKAPMTTSSCFCYV